jgi:hypothetical protein
VLVVVLQRNGVLRGGVVVEVGHGHVGLEAAGAGKEGVVGWVERWGSPVILSLGISHLPGSPGSEGELNRASAVGRCYRGEPTLAVESLRRELSC